MSGAALSTRQVTPPTFRKTADTTTLQSKEDNVFGPFGPLPTLGNLKPEFRSDDMRPVFAIICGILANTQLVKPSDEPNSWLDLTDPRWKGKILADDFRALGGGG